MAADGQTDRLADMTKIIVPFRNFANEAKNGRHLTLRRSALDESLINKFTFQKKYWLTQTGFVSLRLMKTGGPW
jgi:hypothetical protein